MVLTHTNNTIKIDGASYRLIITFEPFVVPINKGLVVTSKSECGSIVRDDGSQLVMNRDKWSV